MGVHQTASTLPGGWTPICNECGIALCWDISDTDYRKRPRFWSGKPKPNGVLKLTRSLSGT